MSQPPMNTPLLLLRLHTTLRFVAYTVLKATVSSLPFDCMHMLFASRSTLVNLCERISERMLYMHIEMAVEEPVMV